MKRYFWLVIFLLPLQLLAQDSTMNSLMKGMEAATKEGKQPAKIFNSERLINANTTEAIGRGKMNFKVTHNFDDIVGNTVNGLRGGAKTFFGLDNSTDIRIGFHIGISDRLDLIVSRAKGGGVYTKTRVPQLYELGFKYQLLRQLESNPSHPISLSIFANNVISSTNSHYSTNPADTALNQPTTFKNFGERMSQVLQAIIAQKAGKIGWLLNFTMIHQGYVPLHDEKTIFAIGGALRLPLSRNINFIIDYFHSFRSQSSKDYFNSVDNSYSPPNDIDLNSRAFKFSDPLGIGLEILTAGHVFHLNFTNATEILENRVIPYTTTSWGKGQFRWGFNISRTFSLWREKRK